MQEENKNNDCQFCCQDFSSVKYLNRHLKNRPDQCLKLEKKCNEKIEKEVERRLNEQKNKLVEKHEKVVDQLIHTKPDVRQRKKAVENVKAVAVVPAFRSVLRNAIGKYSSKQLKERIRLGAEGDIMIFKDLFIDTPTPEERCIRVKDQARDKYEIYDGTTWNAMKLRDIVDIVMDNMADLYFPVLKEKHAMLDEVDRKYPRWSNDESIVDMNIKVYNEVTDLFTTASEHHASLISKEDDLNAAIRNGIQGLLLQVKN